MEYAFLFIPLIPIGFLLYVFVDIARTKSRRAGDKDARAAIQKIYKILGGDRISFWGDGDPIFFGEYVPAHLLKRFEELVVAHNAICNDHILLMKYLGVHIENEKTERKVVKNK